MKRLRVLFVGQNPAVAQDGAKKAFEGTKSGRTLASWLTHMGIDHQFDTVLLMNASEQKTPANARPRLDSVKLAALNTEIASYRADLVFTLGTFASTALAQACVFHYPLPHPSGKNRLLNSLSLVEQVLARAAMQVTKARSSGSTMRRVVLESPFAGDVAANVAYAKRCVHDCLIRGEAPIASHLLFTQPGILDDDKPEERKLGIAAGHAWTGAADAVVVYMDRGLSRGMEAGIEAARVAGVPVEVRNLPGYELEQMRAEEQP